MRKNIDPPYNTGNAFEHYDDNLEHSMWLNLMRPRLEILRVLLCDEGSLWIQIDDEEQAYLKVMCDEVFGRRNFVNMVSVNMKNIAGASGGGEDKRLKKNCEYLLIYAKNYEKLTPFKGAYEYTELATLVNQYKEAGKSWKYTTVLLDAGEKHYHGSTVDGDGNEIKVYLRSNVKTMSIRQVANYEEMSVDDAYRKYGVKLYRTTNAQSSIRQRIIQYRKEHSIDEQFISIEYVPRTGKNKDQLYEQFYKDETCNLLVWLKDTLEEIDGVLYKKDLQGTYWDMNGPMKNVASEGSVRFPQSKKPEYLVSQIIEISSDQNDLILDSFLGSGTTSAVAHKMGRKWIGIEMGEHAYTHCKPRIDSIIEGSDQTGISKTANWQGGGGYRFYELAPTLIQKDILGIEVINSAYNAEMLAAAVALHEGYTYSPDESVFWKQARGTEDSYLYVTTNHIDDNYLAAINSTMSEAEHLLIACSSFDESVKSQYKSISVKKIPQMLLSKCEYKEAGYPLNIISPPVVDEEVEDNG